jgi:hypothetical protein
MAGQFVQIGDRLTFVPPFVNERFDGPPFWACTFTALLNGANVGWLGQKPATHAEVAALAGASGDSDTRGGSRSSHMVRAMKVRYKTSVAIERCSEKEAQRRLANGYALVAGVTYGELPTRHRRWSPRFKLGHRVTVIGWSAGRTRLLDPLAAMGPGYAGEWIAWSDFAKAWWSAEQLWFQEGQYLKEAPKQALPDASKKGAAAKAAAAVDIRVIRRFDPPRHFRVAANTTVSAFSPGQPPVVARKMLFPHASGANFDAIVAFDPAATLEDPTRTFMQVTNGAFAGRYIPLATAGISADIRADQAPAAGAPASATTTVAVGADPATLAAAVLEGRRQEWDRIAHATAGLIVLPPKP